MKEALSASKHIAEKLISEGIAKRVLQKKTLMLNPGRYSKIFFAFDGELMVYQSSPYLNLGMLPPPIPVGLIESRTPCDLRYKIQGFSSLYSVYFNEWNGFIKGNNLHDCVYHIYNYYVTKLISDIKDIHSRSNVNKVVNLVLRHHSYLMGCESIASSETLFEYIRSRTTLSPSTIHSILSRLKRDRYIVVRDGYLISVSDMSSLVN